MILIMQTNQSAIISRLQPVQDYTATDSHKAKAEVIERLMSKEKQIIDRLEAKQAAVNAYIERYY